jgi:threonine synthase
MRCVSTRSSDPSTGGPSVSLAEAIDQGLAPDGGLYVPTALPSIEEVVAAASVPGIDDLSTLSLPRLASAILKPFAQDEAWATELDAICAAAFTFDAPVVPLRTAADGNREDAFLLELFHGPTAAFKDFGARFLAETLSRLSHLGQGERTILVATSGDTGAAVAAAFHRRPGFRVVILYPDGKVSARQAHQLGAFGDNVAALRVAGTFDDCQRMVKAALADPDLRARHGLGSANSISLGRLLPQMAYFAHAALAVTSSQRQKEDPRRKEGENGATAAASFIVPTGNLGNALACLLARRIGFPIGRVVLATNANRVLPDFFATDRYAPRASIATLANAMDVGAPSNLERLLWLQRNGGDPHPRRDEQQQHGQQHGLYRPSIGEDRGDLGAEAVDDDAIRATIARTWRDAGLAVCPHTACGLEVLRRERARGATDVFVVAATAHAAKFDSVVEPLLGAVDGQAAPRSVAVPPALRALLDRPAHAEPIAATDEALRARL